jgi:predicted RNase H-like HicB family nuclease
MEVFLSKTKQNYPVIVEKSDDGFFLVKCPLFDDCYSEGRTLEESLKNIRDIIELRIEEGMSPNYSISELSVHSVAL